MHLSEPLHTQAIFQVFSSFLSPSKGHALRPEVFLYVSNLITSGACSAFIFSCYSFQPLKISPFLTHVKEQVETHPYL